MLSFESSKGATPVAVVKKGRDSGRIAYVSLNRIPENKDDEEDVDDCELGDLLSLLDIGKIATMKKKGLISREEANQLANALARKQRPPAGGIVADEYKGIVDQARENIPKGLKLSDEGKFEPLPRFDKVERVYLTAPSESGKSTWLAITLKHLLRVHPGKRIILLSAVNEDPVLDTLPNLVRVELDPGMVHDPLDLDSFTDAAVVFDDIDRIVDRPLKKYIESLRDSLLTAGRHRGVSVYCTAHLASNGHESRSVLNECSKIVLFPGMGGAAHGIRRLLKEYCGLNTKQIQQFLDLRHQSRWAMVHRDAPMYVMHEKGIYLL